ncbi:MAG: Crp/Fnr family transcriptional regulator, partial [Gammaproteobacteria bacterium]
FEHALGACPVFRSFVMTAYGERVAELISLVEQLSFDPLPVRLAEYLLRHEHDGELHETHQQIARSLGSSREVISRQLKRMELSGAIELHRGWLKVVSPETLSEQANLM